jgi:hypothetical protein
VLELCGTGITGASHVQQRFMFLSRPTTLRPIGRFAAGDLSFNLKLFLLRSQVAVDSEMEELVELMLKLIFTEDTSV